MSRSSVLRKAEPDKWTLSPLSVTSQFSLPAKTKDRVVSENCGLGWLFAALFQTQNDWHVETSSFSVSGLAQLQFDSNLVQDTPFGALGVTATLISGQSQSHTATTVNLPQRQRDWQTIGTLRVAEIDPNDSLEIRVTVTFSRQLSLASQAAPAVLTALSESISTSEFADIKIYLFSRRGMAQIDNGPDVDTQVIATTPLPLFASSRVLIDSFEYFQTLLQGGFGDSPIVNLEAYEPKFQSSGAEYDYAEYDSDLEDDDWDGVSEMPVDQNQSPNPDIDASSALPQPAPSGRMGRVLQLNHWAFRTWMALIRYLYTGSISFSTIGTKERLEKWSCSPKSMYRLAHEVQHEELKRLSMQAINIQLTADNIVNEVFSPFTARYEEILDLETTYFCRNFRRLNFSPALFQENYNSNTANAVIAIMNKMAPRA